MELIVNVNSRDWGIGYDGKLLVSISADLKRFRQLTTGKTVILGRKTLSTFPGGRPLKNRRNIILSSSLEALEGAEVCHTAGELFARLQDCDLSQVSVIGGASVYELLLPYCDIAYITKSRYDGPSDAFFPNLDAMDSWSIIEADAPEEENGISFQYITYRNSSPLPLGASPITEQP